MNNSHLLAVVAAFVAAFFINVPELRAQVQHAAQARKPQQLTSPDQVPEGLQKSDWASIRAAHTAWQHGFMPVEGGWLARNPGQQWTTKFDGRGFLTTPREGEWTWGLELESYGRGQQQTRVKGRPAVKTQGPRLSYAWDSAMQEWWVNDQRGLEHGYTLTQRPPGAEGTVLELTIATRGTLKPQVSENALGVFFVDEKGATVLNYTGLKVTDAEGKVLASRFENVGEGRVRLLVEESAARYPVTIDPIAQQAYVKAADPLGYAGVGDQFGWSVSVSGDTVVVGAPSEDSSATGINSTPNEGATDAGAAYVFVRSGTTWSQQAYLKPAAVGTTQAGDQFGYSVSVSGDTMVIGAYSEDSSTTGINTTPNEGAGGAGAAYVFVRSGSVWSQQAYLKPAAVGFSQGGDQFGYSVSVSGDTVVVGANLEDSSTTGIDSTPDEGAADAGAAYVFERSSTVWSQQAYLKLAAVGTTQSGDQFGRSVSVSGDTVVVGAWFEDSSTTGINTGPNEGAADAGAAYVFVRSGTVWSQQAYLKPADVGISQVDDHFGYSVSVSGDTVVVGAPYEDGSTTGVNSTPNDSASNAGAAYVFVRSGTAWSQQAYLKPAVVGVSQADDQFGYSVAASGDTVVVGATGENSGTTGIGSVPNEVTADSGAAYVYVRSGTTWSQQAYLKASQVTSGDTLGWSVSVSGDTVVVGTIGEDSSTTGINSTPDELASNAGATSIFVRSGTTWSQQAYVKPSDPLGYAAVGDQFGWSVAVSGDTVVVGANLEDSSTTGVNSTPNEGAVDAGAAYVFVRSGTTWSQQAYLKPAAVGTSQANDQFGYSVSVAGDTVVVGARLEASSTTGINSTPNESAPQSGAAYVFVRSGTTWSQQAYLKASQVTANDQFGFSVAVSGDTVVVGAYFEDSSTTGINSTPNESAIEAGAAYVFVRNGTTWSQQAYLKPAAVGTTQANDQFGTSVAVSGNTVVVGANLEDSSTTGIGSTPNESASGAGAAYVFVRSGTTWSQQAYLKPAAIGTTQANDQFGISLAVSGDTVVVGAHQEDSSTTGVGSSPNESAADAGTAYVFVRNGTTWSQQAYLKPAAVGTTQASDNFGRSVAVAGDTVIVGAYFEDSSTTGINSTPNESASAAGAAYVFVRSGTTWSQQAYLKASQVNVDDRFGFSVAVSGETVIVGAYQEDSSTTSINSTHNEGAASAGAIYIFTGPWPAEIAIEQPVGTDLPSGGSRTIGVAVVGSNADLTFTINNIGYADLNLTGTPKVALSGSDAAHFSVTAQPSSLITFGGSTIFTVRFAPTSGGAKTATLTLPNNDADEGAFTIILTGTSLAFTSDTDGDGLNDASEFNMAAFGFDWQVSQPALVNTYYSNANGAGLYNQTQYTANYTAGQNSVTSNPNAFSLYTTSQVQALNAPAPLIQRNPTTGIFTLTIGVEKSTTLVPGSFSLFPMSGVGTSTAINGAGKLEFQFTVPDNAAFFRLQSN